MPCVNNDDEEDDNDNKALSTHLKVPKATVSGATSINSPSNVPQVAKKKLKQPSKINNCMPPPTLTPVVKLSQSTNSNCAKMPPILTPMVKISKQQQQLKTNDTKFAPKRLSLFACPPSTSMMKKSQTSLLNCTVAPNSSRPNGEKLVSQMMTKEISKKVNSSVYRNSLILSLVSFMILKFLLLYYSTRKVFHTRVR